MRRPFASAASADGVDRAANDFREVDGLHVQPYLARHDARDVEDILDNLCQRGDVAFDGLERLRVLVGRQHAGAKQACVAEDRVQRRAQFVRQTGEKVVLELIRLLNARVERCILERDGRPRRHADGEPLVMFAEAVHCGMAEEQPADDGAVASFHRHGQVAAHRQMSVWHPVVWRVVAVSRIHCDVRTADDARALERRLEDLGVPRHRKLREGLSRNAGNRVERVRLPGLALDVVEERSEFRRGQLRGGVGHGLHDFRPVEIGGNDGADLVERRGNSRVLAHETHPLSFPLIRAAAPAAAVTPRRRAARGR